MTEGRKDERKKRKEGSARSAESKENKNAARRGSDGLNTFEYQLEPGRRDEAISEGEQESAEREKEMIACGGESEYINDLSQMDDYVKGISEGAARGGG